MANVKITDLTAIAAIDLAINDVVPIVDINNDQTKKVQLDELKKFVGDANDFVTYTQLNSNINVVSGNVDAVEANVASIEDTGGHTVTFSANLIPSADGVYDLGSSSAKWKDLHLTGSSIKLGTITISELGGEGITITGASGEQANLTTPQLGGVANLSANAAQLAAGIAAAGSGGDATDTETRLNANLNIVQNNVTAVESRRVANVTVMTNEDTALQSRLTTNVTTFTNEDTALQARIAANTLVAASNDFITFTRLQANIDLVQDNVASVTVGTAADTETRLNANLNVLDANADAIESRRVANVTIMTNEDTALQARIAANTLVAASNDFITFTQLNSNINVVQANVANIIDGTTAFTGDVTLEDTTDDAAAGPEFILFRNSASPADGDYLGQIQFKGKQNGGGDEVYAKVTGKISDASAGSEDGLIETAVKGDGSFTIVSRQKSDELQLLNSVGLSVDGSSTFTNQVTMNDDLIIAGNLTVNGATVTINTTNMDVDDTMIMLANGTTGSPANDIGILFNRGNQGNAAFFYDESAKTFKLSDTLDPKSNTALSPVSASNLSVGIIDAATLKYNGLSVDTSISDNVSSLTTNINAVEARRVANIAGAISTVLTSDLTADRVMITNGSGKISQSSGVTPTELGYLDGLTLGTVAASKAVTADANGDVNFIREVDIDGNVTIGTNDSNTVTIVGKLDLGAFS